MLIIGERINSSRKVICDAMRSRDASVLQLEARMQSDAGAHYIDCNAAAVGVEEEPTTLAWAIKVIQDAVDVPVCIDSPNPEAIAEAIKVHRGRALINSITAEKKKLSALLPIIAEHNPRVIALCMSDAGMPKGVEERLIIAESLVEELVRAGVGEEDIFIDPLVLPISVNGDIGQTILRAVAQLRERFPKAHIVMGLTNISHGMPKRGWLNRAFLVMAMAAGLDSVICDPTDRTMMALLIASKALLGQDEFCMNYINAARRGMLDL
ncbi:MAG: dihydropteroate synthase [Armatimonadota bacterium]|nr:dihydropteroate synthase [Armatimonadota bacterium]MCX7777585.1 dihydropteroate synthase [Armatimonadota bacterium]MDW8025594.1 dihydropteroate synthase [Armatimonadota bacterium]